MKIFSKSKSFRIEPEVIKYKGRLTIFYKIFKDVKSVFFNSKLLTFCRTEKIPLLFPEFKSAEDYTKYDPILREVVVTVWYEDVGFDYQSCREYHTFELIFNKEFIGYIIWNDDFVDKNMQISEGLFSIGRYLDYRVNPNCRVIEGFSENINFKILENTGTIIGNEVIPIKFSKSISGLLSD